MLAVDNPLDREWNRLNGTGTDLPPKGVGTVRFLARCGAGRASTLLDSVREVLRSVNQASRIGWPDEDRWKQTLPGWFLQGFDREPTAEESRAWLARWDSLSWDQKQREEREETWTLRNWLHCMEPEQRTWYWWNAEAIGNDMFVVAIEVEAWPFPWSELAWVFKAAGATSFDPEK